VPVDILAQLFIVYKRNRLRRAFRPLPASVCLDLVYDGSANVGSGQAVAKQWLCHEMAGSH
jgi:hypothetical protein